MKHILLADSREPKDVVEMIKLEKDLDVQIRTLDCGDYSDRRELVVIERKALSDFVNSLIHGRLHEQLLRIQQSKHMLKILIIHGLSLPRRSPISWGRLLFAIASIVVRYQISVLWVPDLLSAVRIIAGIIRKVAEGKLGKPRPAPSPHSEVIHRLAKFLGIPAPTCRNLMKRYATISELIRASEGELTMCHGIGRVYAKRIVKRLRDPILTED